MLVQQTWISELCSAHQLLAGLGLRNSQLGMQKSSPVGLPRSRQQLREANKMKINSPAHIILLQLNATFR